MIISGKGTWGPEGDGGDLFSIVYLFVLFECFAMCMY